MLASHKSVTNNKDDFNLWRPLLPYGYRYMDKVSCGRSG